MHSAHAVVRQRRVFFFLHQVETTVRVNAAAIFAAAAGEIARQDRREHRNGSDDR